MAITHAIRMVMVKETDEHDEWLVNLWPNERIVNVEHEGQIAWVYIEREA